MAIYKVQDPNGGEWEIEGPDGATDEEIIAAAQEMFGSAGGGGAGPDVGAVPAKPRRGGGSGFKPEAYAEFPAGNGFIQFNEQEDAKIRMLAAGDPKKEEFLRLIPTIEWRGNAEKMRSKQVSPAGALGPYQFIPETANAFGVKNRLDFGQSAEGASAYYDELNARYGGNFDAMLADYNGGVAAGKAVLMGQAPPAAETREYLQLAQKYRGGGPPQRMAVDTTRREYETGEPEQDGGERTPYPGTEPGAWERTKMIATGAADLGLTIATGSLGEVLGGLTGLLTGTGYALTGAGMDKSVEMAAASKDAVSSAVTYAPKSRGGQAAAQTIGNFAEKYIDPYALKARDLNQEYVGETMGPSAAAALETLVLGLPQVFGARLPKGLVGTRLANATEVRGLTDVAALERAKKGLAALRDRKAIAADIKQRSDRLGIRLNNDELGDSVVKAAEDMAQGPSGRPVTRAAGMDDLRTEILTAEKKSSKAVDRLYRTAYGKRAFVDAHGAAAFGQAKRRDFFNRGFDIRPDHDEFKRLTSILDDLEALPTGAIIGDPKLRVSAHNFKTMEIIRRRMINAIDDTTGSQRKALIELKKDYDKWIDNQFRKTLITGDPRAIAAWKKARKANSVHMKKFNADRAIRDMVMDDTLTPEKVRDLVFGAGAAGLNAQSAQIVKRLKAIVGPNSPSLDSLRSAVLHDAIVPLLSDTPNYSGAVRSIDRLLFKNDSLLKELDIDKKDLLTIRSAAHAAKFVKPLAGDKILSKTFLTKAVARLMLGHQIAKAGLKVGFGKRVLDVAFGTGKMGEKRLLQLFTEAQYKAPIISKQHPRFNDVILHGAYADWLSENGEEEEWRDGDF